MSFVDQDVPDMMQFRKAVDEISAGRDKVLLEALYLGAFRASEICGKATPYDLNHKQSRAYGVHLTWKLDKFEEERVLLLKSAVAKRSCKELKFKMVALPCSPEYEPWTLDLLKWIKDHKGSPEAFKFPLGRHRVKQILQEQLGRGIFRKKTSGKRLLNPLRHYRITHLAEHYDFDAYDLCVYAGWSFKSAFGSVGQLDTYLHIGWRRAFKKLLKPLF